MCAHQDSLPSPHPLASARALSHQRLDLGGAQHGNLRLQHLHGLTFTPWSMTNVDMVTLKRSVVDRRSMQAMNTGTHGSMVHCTFIVTVLRGFRPACSAA